MSIVERVDKLDTPKRKPELQFYAKQAVVMFHDAVPKGYKDAAHMKLNLDLNPLRDRADFNRLLFDMNAKGQ